ncbi:MAG: hypothetical protein ACTSQJ_08345 [Promethearchaeota archaeon]
MSRYSTAMLYTFEFIIVLVLFFILIFFYIKDIDKKSLWVYVITGVFHSIMELIAEGLGVRVIKNASIFTISVGYPFLPIILGFFEGGMICLGAYHFTRIIVNKDKYSMKFFTFLYAIIFTLILFGSFLMKKQLEENPSEITLTRRELFTQASLILLIIFYSIALSYFLLNRQIDKKKKITLFYFFIGVILYTSVMNIPTHIAGIRYIEVKENSSYVPASFFEQIFALYVLDLVIESGFYIQYYVIIYHFNLIEFES